MSTDFRVGQQVGWRYQAGAKLRGLPAEHGRGPFTVLDQRGCHAEMDGTGGFITHELKLRTRAGEVWLEADLFLPVGTADEGVVSDAPLRSSPTRNMV